VDILQCARSETVSTHRGKIIAHIAWRRSVDELRIKSERFMKKKMASTFVRGPGCSFKPARVT
jgi:hypothetical protein